MLKEQDDRCAVCKRHKSEFKYRFAVDHDHITRHVRALLCANCNTMLGSAGDAVEVLTDAIAYLKKWNATPHRSAAVVPLELPFVDGSSYVSGYGIPKEHGR